MSRDLAKPRLVTVVVNERSGGGKAGRELPRIVGYLSRHLVTAEVNLVRSTSFEHAEQTCRTAAMAGREGDAVVVVGGDGMAHAGINACAGTPVTLGIIPAGTGNDFARAIGIPKSIDQAVAVVAAGHSRIVDLAHLSNGGRHWRYVGAVVSSGYDALVNRATNDIRLRFGALSYGWIALRELRDFEPLHYRLRIDGVDRVQDAMLVAVSNTGVFGGGMRIAPDADPADGLLDLTIVHPLSRGTLLRLLPLLYTGGFTKNPAVEILRARQVEIAGEGLFVMGDGEELGDVPVTITCEPGALKVFVSPS